MSAESVARSLAFINWVVLVGLAVGSLAALLLITHRAEATRGYRGFTGHTLDAAHCARQ